MDKWIAWLRIAADGSLDGATDGILAAILVVGILIAVVSLFAIGVSIYLGIAYRKYNRTENSLGKNGEEIARQLLDDHGLHGIKVTCSGSILFGNSYSRRFRKVRLRRRTWHKTSISALAMATQKTMLAVLDQENDPAMRHRMRMMPFIYFGPLAFIPLLIVGAVLDVAILGSNSDVLTIVFALLGIAVYLGSFLLSLLVLKTERKSQLRALDEMRQKNLATGEEIAMCEKLFKLYNIEYVNNMVLAMLEVVYRILLAVAKSQNNSSVSNQE